MKIQILAASVCCVAAGIFGGGQVVRAQAGCNLLDKANPPHYLAFVGVEENRSPAKGESRERVVLRLRNNTDCDITLQLSAPAPTDRVSLRDEFPDGVHLEDLKYRVEFREPLPLAKRRYYQVNDLVYRLQLFAGRSITFSVPRSLFDRWVNVLVSFDYEWDNVPAQHDRGKAWRPPSHQVFFGNEDLPEEIFRRTKVCQRDAQCRSARSNNGMHPTADTQVVK